MFNLVSKKNEEFLEDTLERLTTGATSGIIVAHLVEGISVLQAVQYLVYLFLAVAIVLGGFRLLRKGM